MKKCAIAAAVAGLLLFSGTALAAEQNKTDEHSGHGTTQVQPTAKKEESKSPPTPTKESAQTHNMTPDEHKNMNNTSQEQHQIGDSHGQDSATHEGEASSAGHGGHGEVQETPPNIPVLSTFGAINAAFLLYGVWNKWLRKKGGALA